MIAAGRTLSKSLMKALALPLTNIHMNGMQHTHNSSFVQPVHFFKAILPLIGINCVERTAS